MALSEKLLAKAVTLYSMTIDSPTGRVSKRSGEPIRPTVYFDKKDKAGKPAKGCKVYTPNADEAKAIDNCTAMKVETVKFADGSKVRFLDDNLTDKDREEIKTHKAQFAADDVINSLNQLMKKATSQTVLAGLTTEQREHFANALGGQTLAAVNRLKAAPAENNKKVRVTIW